MARKIGTCVKCKRAGVEIQGRDLCKACYQVAMRAGELEKYARHRMKRKIPLSPPLSKGGTARADNGDTTGVMSPLSGSGEFKRRKGGLAAKSGKDEPPTWGANGPLVQVDAVERESEAFGILASTLRALEPEACGQTMLHLCATFAREIRKAKEILTTD